jgi:hypothetical protein
MNAHMPLTSQPFGAGMGGITGCFKFYDLIALQLALLQLLCCLLGSVAAISGCFNFKL